MPPLTELDYADDLADEFMAADEATKSTTMTLLAEYEAADDFENWCEQQHVDKEDPRHQTDYNTLHLLFITLWRRDEHDFYRRLAIARVSLKQPARRTH